MGFLYINSRFVHCQIDNNLVFYKYFEVLSYHIEW